MQWMNSCQVSYLSDIAYCDSSPVIQHKCQVVVSHDGMCSLHLSCMSQVLFSSKEILHKRSNCQTGIQLVEGDLLTFRRNFMVPLINMARSLFFDLRTYSTSSLASENLCIIRRTWERQEDRQVKKTEDMGVIKSDRRET